jgi:glycosyltransferase involved in cell wall biosynthesis
MVKEGDSQAKHFLYLSNFMKGKGQNFALIAFAKIHHNLPLWKLRFVGGDMGLEKNREYLLNLKQEASHLKISEKIEWVGFAEDVEKEYKQADIVLNFSESESFSITCLEASYFGRPLIATDCGGPAEIIRPEETGLLVPNRKPEEMAIAMLQLALNEVNRERMGLKAREVVTEKFNFQNTTMKLQRLYQAAISADLGIH